MFINDVRLVGRLYDKPEFKTSGQGKKYAVMNLQTGRLFKNRWVFQKHRIVCFKASMFPVLEKSGEKGVWVTVQGELTYFAGGSSQVTVAETSGQIEFMFSDLWRTDEEMTDEEYALVGDAKDSGLDYDMNTQGNSGSTQDQSKDLDDEIPF
ncbi:single-stranded DNA-binding protein [Sulfitobacter sp. R18_1]|uniref:single-stranded DNA-binding protein n=1 Tax=Sulfitobacter sp. R18_1 TaxID=2821104 RepID=UPI001ADD052C|nr:single-stranded DNA-binding protein [Sulfitobacter sp. R18_1]MBO9428382.1 single-stranded DNA-binding protein [Sulfitobacter sp. R18_1]